VKDVQARLGHGTATLTLDNVRGLRIGARGEISDRLDQLRTGVTASPSRTQRSLNPEGRSISRRSAQLTWTF
jgi:hypothetical protein